MLFGGFLLHKTKQKAWHLWGSCYVSSFSLCVCITYGPVWFIDVLSAGGWLFGLYCFLNGLDFYSLLLSYLIGLFKRCCARFPVVLVLKLHSVERIQILPHNVQHSEDSDVSVVNLSAANDFFRC